MLGGTLLTGGEVSVLGAVLGAVVVEVISSGLYMMQIGQFWIQASLGIVLLAGDPAGAHACRRRPGAEHAAMTHATRLLRADWLGLLMLVVLGGAALGIARPEFLTAYSIDVILVSFCLTVVYALGQGVIIAIGHMNLALGAIGGLVAIAFGGAMQVWHFPVCAGGDLRRCWSAPAAGSPTAG